ncbi:MAG: AraC family transcriptional regulator [Oscillospiraceae bacterium]
MNTKINQYLYPFIGQVRDLPVYLTGIGGTEYQGRIKRPEGYCWHQILYCADGSGTLLYGNISVKISAGCFFFLPAFYPHEYYPDDEKWDIRWTVFDGYSCEQMLSELNMNKPVILYPEDGKLLSKLFDKMYVALKTDKIYGNFTCAGLVYQYLMEFHRLADSDKANGFSDKSNILMPVLNYIDDNFRNNFSMTVLSEIAGVSHQYLCRVFKQTMNIRPNEYVVCRRLTEAKRLLAETDLSVSDIAEHSGFSDTGYFCTVFRRQEKMTPSEYRKLHNISNLS